MVIEQNYRLFITKVFIALSVIATVWTSISLYNYYSGPRFQINTYMEHLAKKEYDKIYEMLDTELVINRYSREEIIDYYTKIYDRESSLVEIARVSEIVYKDKPAEDANRTAFCNMKYTYTNKEQTAPLYLVKKEDKWRIQFPFSVSEVKIHAPIGSSVYLNNQQVSQSENEIYVENNVLPGKYTLRVEFPNKMYSPYNQIISIPEQKEVFLPYNTLNVEITTIRNMIVKLEDIEKNSRDGIAVFNNILEGNYKVKVFSANDYINPVEMDIFVSKDSRLFNALDVTLSPTGKDKLNQFIKDFYNSYLKDIREKRHASIVPYIHEETRDDFINYFREWFIDHKDIQEAKIAVQPSHIQIDQQGFLHTDLLETVELVNKEYDEYENGYINRKYKVILEWGTVIDMLNEEWVILDRTLKQSIVSYEDLDGRWVQY